jgi:hypothetical protein
LDYEVLNKDFQHKDQFYMNWFCLEKLHYVSNLISLFQLYS